MSITPNEILEKEFSKRFRGYDKKEVKLFLEEVANFLAFLIKERNELKDKVLRYKKRILILKKQEAEFKRALTTAQKAIEDMRENAQKEANLIIDRAKIDADRIVADAHQEAIALEDRIRKLKVMQRETVYRIRSSVESFLRVLDDEMTLLPENVDESLRIAAKEVRVIQEEKDASDKSNENKSLPEGSELKDSSSNGNKAKANNE